MADTPDASPEKPKKKIITVGVSEGGGSEEPRGDRGRSDKGRRGGGGRGRDRDERDRKPSVPPALMRGPKPKPKAAAAEAPEEVVDEAIADETAETAEGETAPEAIAEPTTEGEAAPEAAAEEPSA